MAPGYVASLSEFGGPRPLPRSGGWLLEREIAGAAARDLMGPYPLFACADWDVLPEDLEELDGAVSVVLVADPLTAAGEAELPRAFPDRVAPFKRHHVRDLEATARLPEHHRRHVRRASRAVEVELCADPAAHLDDWVGLYARLAERHGLTGIQAFSREAFRRQLALPGLVAVRAERAGETVGMALWLEDAPNAWYHLGAYSDAGYEVSASYALFAGALAELRERGVRHVDLGGAAGGADADDGLVRFKRGWATEERTAFLCGRVLDREAYDRLAAGSETDWFPAYRAPVAV
jgi:Acetyltransferase (GNAT) domain